MTTPPQSEDVPYEVQVCPKCKSTEIQRREGFHPLGRWGCRACDRAFFLPGLQIMLLPPGQDPPPHWQ
ncbi:MAG: hypothetical protein FI731_04345 [SAR202 cluster bacterium]|nr:hypothetical protein [SAR202 cluster bacterium]